MRYIRVQKRVKTAVFLPFNIQEPESAELPYFPVDRRPVKPDLVGNRLLSRKAGLGPLVGIRSQDVVDGYSRSFEPLSEASQDFPVYPEPSGPAETPYSIFLVFAHSF